MVEGSAFETIDALLEQPYWVVDPLPWRVPAQGEGQFFAVENFFLDSAMSDQLLRKHARILLKINCYYDILVVEREEGRWTKNPDPEELYRRASDKRRHLSVLLGEDTLIVLSDYDMTVYDPDRKILELVRALAGAEGLFVWQPEVSTWEEK